MNIIVVIKQVPDLVEELEINSEGTDLDREWLKFKLNEFDDQALEEALQIKESSGGSVTVVALDNGADIDKALFAAAAKGADKLVKITGDFEGSVSTHKAAKVLANAIGGMDANLILTGVQAVDDRDGQTAVILGRYLNIPHASVVTSVDISGTTVTIQKEYGGGIVGEFEGQLPLVLGIQTARETPRYVPVAKVRRAMRSATIEEVSGQDDGVDTKTKVSKMYKPTVGDGAEMLSGSAEDVGSKIVEIIRSKGV